MEDRDWQRLARYYSGEASPEEEGEIRRWLESDPESARLAESLRGVWDLSGSIPPPHQGDAERVWERVAAGIHARGQEISSAPASAPTRPPRFGGLTGSGGGRRTAYLLAAAAALLLLLIPVVGGGLPGRTERAQAPSATVREYATRAGERLSFLLADGSSVDLGPNSTLTVPVPFEGDRREVRLVGMAHFSVVTDSTRPFLVRAGDAVTRVLGTRFVVRAYTSEPTVRVAVVEGRVALGRSSEADQGETVLAMGQLGELASGGVPERLDERGDFDRLVGWTTGRLEFVDEPLAEVLSELETWYNVEIILSDPELASHPFSTEIEGETLEQMLELIALAVDARYERSGDQITFTSQ